MALFVAFVLPLGLWVALYRTRTRLQILEGTVQEQRSLIDLLGAELKRLKAQGPARGPEAAAPAQPASAPTRVTPPALATPPAAAAPSTPSAPPVTPVTPPVTPAVKPPVPLHPRADEKVAVPPRTAVPPAVPTAVPPTAAGASTPAGVPSTATAPTPAARPAAAVSTPATTPGAVQVPPSPPRPPIVPPRAPSTPPTPPAPPQPPAPSFDWEKLIGAQAFPMIAGVALVIAAIAFLKHSLDQGWLQPPVRVLIGTAVALGLLVVCELKAARKYRTVANALDAAAIAILFATFFAARALWDLIPGTVAFGLLAAVTALAVLLSIRRESLFIAVLGLLGGFSTPVLLSTGENQPIPLFAYLALLNIGLAWVAHRQSWPVLSVLTLILTTLYQWGWVMRFLDGNQLSLALGIFALFPVVSVAGLMFGRRGRVDGGGNARETFERTTMAASALPLLFVGYLASVPAYGARPDLLFGFLLLVDLGLLAIGLGLRRPMLHGIGALATVLVWAVWLTSSYAPGSGTIAIGFTAAFVTLYLFAPSIARWRGVELEDAGARAVYAAPIMLFVLAVVARIEPAFADPRPLVGVLLVLVLLCAWRAVALGKGAIFFTASFFAVAVQGAWSATHLDVGRVPTAVVIYAVFGILTAAIPIFARRIGRDLEPEWGGGVVLLTSLALLLFLSLGPIAPTALWGLALLLAILNAALFIESASIRVPLLSQIGSLVSWIILASWWFETAGVVGIIPSLAVVTGLALVTLLGHAFAARAAGLGTAIDHEAREFTNGLYLGLIGHLFLFFVAVNREWSLPPWPLFGALAVITLAASAVALAVRTPVLHVASLAGSAAILTGFMTTASVMPWTLVGIAAAAILSVYALAWTTRARAGGDGLEREGAAAALIGSLVVAALASVSSQPPAFGVILVAETLPLAILLTLTCWAGWRRMASAALILTVAILMLWQAEHDLADWPQLLMLVGAFYATFTVYALVAGPRLPDRREPWLVALGAAVMAFIFARQGFEAGELEWMIGVVPVVLGAVTALLLRVLLKMERPGERDLTRLALVAGVALAFVTVAIPLQLDHQWITIGWALEAGALAWLYGRVPHRGLLLASAALFAAVFVRLTMNPSVWIYEPRGGMRILNWYLYTYLLAAAAMFAGAWYMSKTSDRIVEGLPRLSRLLPAAAVVVLFYLLNIEIADYYATGPEITFRFGVTVSQDLTYTIGWLAFGMVLLAAGIYVDNRPARGAAVALIAVTTFKCFLYDLSSLEGLYRVGSFVGLALSLTIVSLVLQKYVLAKPTGTA